MEVELAQTLNDFDNQASDSSNIESELQQTKACSPGEYSVDQCRDQEGNIKGMLTPDSLNNSTKQHSPEKDNSDNIMTREHSHLLNDSKLSLLDCCDDLKDSTRENNTDSEDSELKEKQSTEELSSERNEEDDDDKDPPELDFADFLANYKSLAYNTKADSDDKLKVDFPFERHFLDLDPDDDGFSPLPSNSLTLDNISLLKNYLSLAFTNKTTTDDQDISDSVKELSTSLPADDITKKIEAMKLYLKNNKPKRKYSKRRTPEERKNSPMYPYHCQLCEYKSKTKALLDVHMCTHTGIRPFACNICPYRGTSKSNLIKHIKTHAGVKHLTCKTCGYRTGLKGHLTIHERIHTGEKPYRCEQCPYACVQKSSLKDHMRTHTGEKPFVCDFCDYRCMTKSNLKVHVRRHHSKDVTNTP